MINYSERPNNTIGGKILCAAFRRFFQAVEKRGQGGEFSLSLVALFSYKFNTLFDVYDGLDIASVFPMLIKHHLHLPFRNLIVIHSLLGMLGGCGQGAYEDLSDGALAGKAEITSEQQLILKRIKAREREFLRAFKVELSIGETNEGLIGEPDERSEALENPSYAEHVLEIINEENEDREAYYAIEVQKYLLVEDESLRVISEATVDKKISEALASYGKEMTEQNCEDFEKEWFCSKLVFWLDCEALEAELYHFILSAVETTVDAAGKYLADNRDDMIRIAVEAAKEYYAEILLFQVREVHAVYWQDKRTKSGEWIQNKDGDWKLKP